MPVDILDDILGAAPKPKPDRELIPISKIRVDGGTQMRAQLNEETVQEYTEVFLKSHAWGGFPPVVLFYDGTEYWVGDGFHRIEAYLRAVTTDGGRVPVHADVRVGTRRDAVLFAAGANADHGLRRTNQDKRRSVETLLRDPEWQQWSNHEIARRCAVAESSVRNIRTELERTAQIAQSTERKGADGRTINTSNIGRTQTKAQRSAAMVPLVVEYARNYQDRYGRTVRLLEVHSAAHTNSTFWSDITKEWRQRGLEIDDDILKPAIKTAIAQLKDEIQQDTANVIPSNDPGSRHQGAELAKCSVCHRPLSDPASAVAGVGPCCAAKRAAAAAAGDTLDDLEVVDSVTVRVEEDGKLLIDWSEEEWAAYERKLKERQFQHVPAPEPVCNVPPAAPALAAASAAVDILTPDRNEPTSPAQQRNERIDSILRRLYAAEAAATEFENLTGIYTYTPALRRVMDAMISTLEANRI